MGKILYQVDSFTGQVFGGNPAGVCIMKEVAPKEWMTNIAAEMNLSETAFLFPEKDGYNLRWFTPEAEVELCGHATLATAHILWEQGHLDINNDDNFYTLSGLLTAKNLNKGIELDFPSTPPKECDAPNGLLEALGLDHPVYVGKNKFDYLIELDSPDKVRRLSPNFSDLKKTSARGIMVTAASDEKKYDFISRFFAPAFGIDEDPVTGSAHCTLGPYWAEKLGKTRLDAYQASKRGGEVGVAIDGDRIKLTGEAVTVFKLELL